MDERVVFVSDDVCDNRTVRSLQVTMNLEEPDKGTTVLKLQQTGIPEYDRFGNEMREVERQVEEGWKAQILHRLRAVFGFGM